MTDSEKRATARQPASRFSDDSVPALTFDDARALTDQIKTALTDIWELIKRAYLEKAWHVLGYDSWDRYVKAEFGTRHRRLPREERESVVAFLREAGLSIRDTASATGCDKNTVIKDEKKRRVSEFQTPIDLDTPNGNAPKRKPKPKPDTFSNRFYGELSQVQHHALALEIQCKKPEFATHRDYVTRHHREGLVWAHEVIARLLTQLTTDQDDLFDEPKPIFVGAAPVVEGA